MQQALVACTLCLWVIVSNLSHYNKITALSAFHCIHRCLLSLKVPPFGVYIWKEKKKKKKMNGTKYSLGGSQPAVQRLSQPGDALQTCMEATPLKLELVTALAAKPASSKPPLSLSTGRTSGSRGDLRLLLQSKISKHSPSNSSTCPQFFQYVFLTQPEQQLYRAPIMHFSRSLCIRSLETQLEVRAPAHQQLSQCFTGKKTTFPRARNNLTLKFKASSCPVEGAATPAEAAQSTFCLRRYSHPVLQLEEEREGARSCRDQPKGTAVILYNLLADGLASSLELSQWKGEMGSQQLSTAIASQLLPPAPAQHRIRGLKEHIKDLARHHAKLLNQKIAS